MLTPLHSEFGTQCIYLSLFHCIEKLRMVGIGMDRFESVIITESTRRWIANLMFEHIRLHTVDTVWVGVSEQTRALFHEVLNLSSKLI
jgi:hypothetical protein